MTIIGIAGGTGSGKTTVVRKIAQALPPHYVAVVPLDSYYNDTTDSTDHFLHGEVIINQTPNNDSLAPMINYMKADVDHLIETLRWK